MVTEYIIKDMEAKLKKQEDTWRIVEQEKVLLSAKSCLFLSLALSME